MGCRNMKRTASPEFEVAVKLQYKETDALASSTLERPESPPIIAKKASKPRPRLSAVEAGDASVEDHFLFFSSKLLEASRPYVSGTPRICHQAWCELYQRNLNPQGRHSVIYQHDHPVAGTHYDLRLQCNGTSSISFSIMYGLPGDPKSRRLNRNATETRVHTLWVGTELLTGTLIFCDTVPRPKRLSLLKACVSADGVETV
jgi:DNA polymerase Ligase (LigD)